ncbi:unnamed protein product [Didymodactylos carnosus]|nr:unnamed protein product [Didymodactylos carnosus]CAF3812935.1 unnamed protein product [Didymodactylos carnosus]
MQQPPPPPRLPNTRLPNDGGVFFGGNNDYRRNYPPNNNQQQQINRPFKKDAQQWYRGPLPPQQNQLNSRPPGPPPLCGPPPQQQQQWFRGPLPSQQNQMNPPPPPLVPPPFGTPFGLPPVPHPFMMMGGPQQEQQQQHGHQNNNIKFEGGQIPFLEGDLLYDNGDILHEDSNENKRLLPPQPTISNNNSQNRRADKSNNRNIISYQDLDRPDERETSSFDTLDLSRRQTSNNKISTATSSSIQSSSITKANTASSLTTTKEKSFNFDETLKLELDRIKKADAEQKEKLKQQRLQAELNKEKTLTTASKQHEKRNYKTTEREKREDGEYSSDDDEINTKRQQKPPSALSSSANLTRQQTKLKKLIDNMSSNERNTFMNLATAALTTTTVATTNVKPIPVKQVQTTTTTTTQHPSPLQQISVENEDEEEDFSLMKIIRPLKLFHIDPVTSKEYREYLQKNYKTVRSVCDKPQCNFLSNLSCIEELKRRQKIIHNKYETPVTPMLKHLLADETEDGSVAVAIKSEKINQTGIEHEDGEIDESDDEMNNSGLLKMELDGDDKKKRKVTVDEEHQQKDVITKKQKTLNDEMNTEEQEQNDDGTKQSSGYSTLTGAEDKPWMTPELRQLIKQRKRLQAQILAGDTNVEVKKKFKKLRNTICRLARSLKAKYEKSTASPKSPTTISNGISTLNQSLNNLQPSLSNDEAANTITTSLASSTTASNTQSPSQQNLLQSFLDPTMFMMMLMNPTLYSSVQQQVLSNPNFLSAYQNMVMKSTPGKGTSETQVVPAPSVDQLLKQTTTSTSKPQENNKLMQQILLGSGLSTNQVKTERILGLATKPINLNTSDTTSTPSTDLLNLLENVTSVNVDNRKGPQTPPGSPPNKTGITAQTGAKPRTINTPITPSTISSITSDSPKTAVTPGAPDQPEIQFNAQEMANNSKFPRQFQQQHQNQGQPGVRSRERGHINRHIPLTSEQMKEVLARAKNYVTSKQNDDVPTTPPISHRRHISAAQQQNMITQKETAAQQAAAAAIAAVQSQAPLAMNTTSSPHSAHPIRIQLDYQKSKTLTSVIPTINNTPPSPLLPVKTSQSPAPSMEPTSYQPPPPQQQQPPSPFFQQNWAQQRALQPNSPFPFTPSPQIRGPSRPPPPMHPQHQYSQQHLPFDPQAQFYPHRYPHPSQQISQPPPPPIRHPGVYNQNQYYPPHHHPQHYPPHHYPPPR